MGHLIAALEELERKAARLHPGAYEFGRARRATPSPSPEGVGRGLGQKEIHSAYGC